jgi:L-malate glycosyltransferase
MAPMESRRPKQFDLLVMPSRSEGYGWIAVEGLAAGLPVVANQVGGLREIWADGVGFVVPIRDDKSVAASIISLLKNLQKMAEVGKRGHDRVFEIFTPMRCFAQLERSYVRLLCERGIANVAC